MWTRCFVWLLVVGWALPGTAAAEDLKGLATALAEMRADVERLNGEVDDARRAQRDRLRALGTQLAEAEAELRRDQLRVQQLREAVDRKRGTIAKATQQLVALTPVVTQAAGALRAHVEGSLPFKRDERLAAIAEIEGQLARNLLTPQGALARLWALGEDELRLTRDTGLFRQTVSVEGAEVLADVVRLGMVAMFYRTGAGGVGVVRRGGDGWQVEPITAAEAAEQVTGLFDAFKKQIRVGFFELPAFLGAEGAG